MDLPLLVGVQSVLYAALWAAASLWLRQELRSTLLWMGYALAAGLSFVLIGMRPDGPLWLTHTGASVFHVLGLVFARYGVEVFLRVQPNRVEYAATLILGFLVFAWIGPQDEAPRVALTSMLSATLLLGAMLSCWAPLRREFGGRFALAAAVPIAALFLVNVKLGWSAALGANSPVVYTSVVTAVIWTVTLVVAAVFNFLFLFLLGMRMQRSLSRTATHDPLTSVLNRRGMQSLLQVEWQRSQRYGAPFTVIALDVDHFKKINDTHGHDAGDKVLVALAALLDKEVRDTDRVARMGGEEFLLLLPSCRANVEGVRLAQRLRNVLARMPVTLESGGPLTVTASWGVAGHSGQSGQDASLEDLLRRADAALYEGKRQGRDRVVLSGGDVVVPAGAAGTDAGAADGVGGHA